jgi:hypothetical protein
MYVMSGDGYDVHPIGAVGTRRTRKELATTEILLHPNEPSLSVVLCRLGDADDGGDKKAAARIADYAAWLNADETTRKDADEFVAGMLCPVTRTVRKPAVYDFGKPVGYWRQP